MPRLCGVCGEEIEGGLCDHVYVCDDGCGTVVCEACYDDSDGTCPDCGATMDEEDI